MNKNDEILSKIIIMSYISIIVIFFVGVENLILFLYKITNFERLVKTDYQQKINIKV